MGSGPYKVKVVGKGKLPRWRQYAEWVVGRTDLWGIVKYELITCLFGNFPGALGLYLRSKFYSVIIGRVGKNVVFGRGITLRHPHKIRIGHNVTIDDNCMLDAKGASNNGIIIEDGVFIGRNSIIYCKDGDIDIKERSNISFNCEVFSSNKVVIGEKVLIAAYCYIMSGGSYDHKNVDFDFVDQDGYSKGPTIIDPQCWLGARVTVFDGVSIGAHTVVGAGALVNKDLPSNVVAIGLPAKVVEQLSPAVS